MKWHLIDTSSDAVKVYWRKIAHKIESTPPIECIYKEITLAIHAEPLIDSLSDTKTNIHIQKHHLNVPVAAVAAASEAPRSQPRQRRRQIRQLHTAHGVEMSKLLGRLPASRSMLRTHARTLART